MKLDRDDGALSRVTRCGIGGIRAALLVTSLVACQPSGLISGATGIPATPTPSLPATTPPGATPEGSPTPPPTFPSVSPPVVVITTPSPTPPPAPTPTPTPTPKATPTPAPTHPAIVTFTVPQTVDCTNGGVQEVTLSWSVANATGVELAIDGPGKYDEYPAVHTVSVPFTCSEPQHTYRITTVGGSGPPATMEKVVTRSP